MRFMKKAMAFAMAVMLAVPSITVMATEGENPAVLESEGSEELLDSSSKEDAFKANETEGETFDSAEDKAEVEEPMFETEIPSFSVPEVDGQGDTSEKPGMDVVQFNTGNCVFSLISKVDYERLDEEGEESVKTLMEAYPDFDLTKTAAFADDGSYTINIPEENPFFPYEVQFTYNGEKINKWFMSPDDSVEVGGHMFRVNAAIDGTSMTQMSLEVAGETVAVYPENKEFTNDGDGTNPASLIPLKSRDLTVDLTGFTPVELTMVSISAKFTEQGEDLSGATKIVWKPKYADDNYIVSGINDQIDLSCNSSIQYWEMIIGDGNQLNPNNIRYSVKINTTPSSEWLLPKLYVQDAKGSRLSATIYKCNYNYSYMGRAGWLEIIVPSREIEEKDLYLSLEIDKSKFSNSKISNVKYVEGTYVTVEEANAALGAHDVTDQIMCENMDSVSAGYKINRYNTELTMIAYNDTGNVIGCLPFKPQIYGNSEYVTLKLYDNKEQLGSEYVYGKNYDLSFGLEEPRELNGDYTLILEYDKGIGSEYPAITSVYIGQYESVAQAVAAGATDIKDMIYGSINDEKGYTADFSKGVYFTVFAGEDTNPNQAVYSFNVKTERIVPDDPPEPSKERGTNLTFIPYLIDEDGNKKDVYIISNQDDSYAEGNYITMLVPAELDMSKEYAPVFIASNKATVYTAGASAPEVSGKSFHLLGNPLQYTVNAENEVAVKNYWLQVKQADSAANGQLYINSLTDENANTRVENGIIYSTREMMLDSYHDNKHDICFVNVGGNDLKKLSANLDSDVVEIDPYWTLNGEQSLSGMSTIYTPGYDSGLSGELPNLAKVRLRKKSDVKDGTEISGTLTIKSGETILMVLTLTGTVGDPCITTEQIPDAVKYVPYGTVIQNSNKYSWIQPSYEISANQMELLPEGMEIKPNGELYGIPQETGRFEFTVKVSFKSMRDITFPSKYAKFTLIVNENTDYNVYNESDGDGYNLLTPIGVEIDVYHFYLEHVEDSLFVSEGPFDDFIDLWLNGKKLKKGVDYTVESGSTRITVIAQTMKNLANQNGRNTIAAEFRVNGDINDNLKRTAQNFYLDNTKKEPGHEGGGSSTGNSGGSGGNSSTGSPGGSGGNSSTGSPGGSGGNGNIGNSGGNSNIGGLVSSKGTASVATGDTLDFNEWMALMLLSIAVLTGFAFFCKKKSLAAKEEQ